MQRQDVVAQALSELSTLAARGAIRPLIGEQVPVAEAPRALQDLGDGIAIGRMVVMPDGSYT